MKRKGGARRLAILGCAWIVVCALTLIAYADTTTTQTPCSNVQLSYETGTYVTAEYAAGTLTVKSVDKAGEDSCGDATYESQTGTITVENTGSAEAVITFDYTPGGAGTYTVAGSAVTSLGTYQGVVAAGSAITVTVASGGKTDGDAWITLSNFGWVENVTRDLTFVSAEGGSITVGGETVTGSKKVSARFSEGIEVTAAPASNYTFLAWVDESDHILAQTANATIRPTSDATIHALFVPSGSTQAYFKAGSTLYTDLNEAAASGASTVILLRNATITSGNYTIPSGVTLLIPFDDINTVYTTAPEVLYAAHVNPSAYRTLTLASGVSITVSDGGAISVPSKLCANGTGKNSWNGTPTGPHGKINMAAGSSITVSSGGALYCYGYISGRGTIEARSGAEIWEAFQIRCWRGGSCTTSSAWTDGRVFPLSQYYVQNIEAPLTLYAGAAENVYAAVNASSSAFTASAQFIGADGMFYMTEGKLTKYLDAATDQVVFDVEGTCQLQKLSLTISGIPMLGNVDLDTDNYVLPINSNIVINLLSGSVAIDQELALLPGSVLTVAEGASVAANKNVYVYDVDEWGKYAAAGETYVPVGYTAANGTTSKRLPLTDAKVDLNGTITVNEGGGFYTTKSGAQVISSSGSGALVHNAAAGTETTTRQGTQNDRTPTIVEIEVTAAKLVDGDGSYTPTAGAAAGLTFLYHKDAADDANSRWYNYTVTWSDGSAPLRTDYIAVTEGDSDTFTPDHTAITAAEASGSSAEAALKGGIAASIDAVAYGEVAESVTVTGIDADTAVTLTTHPYRFKNLWNLYTYTDSTEKAETQETHYVSSMDDYYDFGSDASGQAYIVRPLGSTNTTTYLPSGGRMEVSGSRATIRNQTADTTAWADGRNYSWYVKWYENGQQTGVDFLKSGETDAAYAVPAREGVKWICRGVSVPEGAANVTSRTNTAVTVLPGTDCGVNLSTEAATDTYTYYLGGMAFELYANSMNYAYDSVTHTWTPATSSYKWRAASGTNTVTYQGERYSVNNGTIKLINLSNQVVDMTVTLTPSTAADPGITSAKLIFTAPDGTTWNDRQTLTLQPGRVMTVTVQIDEASLDPNTVAQNLSKVAFGTISVEAAVNDSAQR